MGFKIKQNHMIDFLFPLALLFVFALSALTVTLFATKVYESTVDDSARSNSARTALSYVTEKIHAGDEAGDVTIGEFDGRDAVIMQGSYDGKDCTTYIYVDKNQLKELFVKSNFTGGASNGTAVLPVNRFTMKQIDDSLMEFTCTDDNGKRISTTVAIRSSREVR